jgi:hypothetical protein
MHLVHRILPAVALLAFSACSVPVYAAAAGPAGHWEGRIQLPDRELSITVDLAQGPEGGWIGSLKLVMPGGTDIPLLKILVSGGTVRFAASLPGDTSFEGTLSADATKMEGKVSNAEGAVPFTLTRTGEANVKIPPRSSPLSKEFEGTWEGAVERDGKTMRLRMKLSPAPDGTATALLVSVDKGNLEIPVTTVTLQGAQLVLDVRVVAGTFSGTLGAGGEIAGEWTEKATRLPLTFKKVEVAK